MAYLKKGAALEKIFDIKGPFRDDSPSKQK
jgi:hypothetical protein